ncbi:hypothetical protein RFI_30157 [Reticulomyxa filosa]|uniref:Uncharacterized protein n=1 Tax=Reticulomyxa filosa TaxID=46433 RepID=X6M022_RETFI|nr:hypothetical protein RFI_30157 [Reticulomyxa filosa]|eukprot:ETO07234.1 hypothetical protein RFI_30157 [Reticulomyxa filosa]
MKKGLSHFLTRTSADHLCWAVSGIDYSKIALPFDNNSAINHLQFRHAKKKKKMVVLRDEPFNDFPKSVQRFKKKKECLMVVLSLKSKHTLKQQELNVSRYKDLILLRLFLFLSPDVNRNWVHCLKKVFFYNTYSTQHFLRILIIFICDMCYLKFFNRYFKKSNVSSNHESLTTTHVPIIFSIIYLFIIEQISISVTACIKYGACYCVLNDVPFGKKIGGPYRVMWLIVD